MNKQPVIILGMGRSGTSMLSRLLESLGLFVGKDKRGGNNESWFFYRLNDWMLRCANATWDNPHNFNFIDDQFREDFSRVAESHMRGIGRVNYLGWKNALKYRDIKDIDFPWGWKDPRNTFTIDVWKEIFPECKVVHIYRHPLDSAESARYGKESNKVKKKRNWRWGVREALLLRVGYQLSARTGNIHEAIKLWEEYLVKALSWTDVFGDNIHHVRYESLLEDPMPVMQELLQFIDMPAAEAEISRVIQDINPDRKYAFLRNPELVNIYEKMRHSELMQQLGYSDISI
ncbi:MAG: sulfotransferase [Gammaproteobacteria bacterium]|nr:sulfotransferase [Gammaproteobacteria bacterium]